MILQILLSVAQKKLERSLERVRESDRPFLTGNAEFSVMPPLPGLFTFIDEFRTGKTARDAARATLERRTEPLREIAREVPDMVEKRGRPMLEGLKKRAEKQERKLKSGEPLLGERGGLLSRVQERREKRVQQRKNGGGLLGFGLLK